MEVVPDSVVEAAMRTSENVRDLESHLMPFLSLCKPEVLDELPPLERAQSLLLLSKATSTLFTLRLRCSGVNPDDHPVKSELDRLSLYQSKLERFIDLNKAPLRPSTTLNHKAAARFIEHSLPDLTPEQRKSMRDISKGEGTKIKYLDRGMQKKRKYQSFEKQNVRAVAEEFLEKAARELLGNKKSAFKGPLQGNISDDDDDDEEDLPVG